MPMVPPSKSGLTRAPCPHSDQEREITGIGIGMEEIKLLLSVITGLSSKETEQNS